MQATGYENSGRAELMGRFNAVLRKDLRLELRGGESTIALVAIALLVLIVLVFALNPTGGSRDAQAAAGALWIALIFAGVIGAGRAMLAERDNGCIRALILSPIDPATLYLAKLAASFIFMTVAEMAALIMMVLFFNLTFDDRLLRLTPLIALGALGFAALATLLAAITGRVRAGDLLLPILIVPLFVPALIAGVKGSAAALAGAQLADLAQWLKILVAFDVLFLAAGYLLFEYVVGED
jgi:heme exporter protein B